MSLVEKLNFKIDVDSLRDYYRTLTEEYKDYIWRVETLKEIEDYTLERIKNSLPNYGWAITTEILDETIKTAPPWPEILPEFSYADKTLRPERRTAVAFGIAEKLLEAVPYASHVIISVFPPGGGTIPHSDQDFLLRVHVPIYTNKQIFWATEDGYQCLDKVGQPYLCDTRKIHAVYNDSNEDRVHLIFAIEDKYINDIKKITGTIK